MYSLIERRPTVRAAAPAADWQGLLTAARGRLQQLAARVGTPSAWHDDLRACLNDLDRIQATVRLEVGRRRRLELDAFDARAARALMAWSRPSAGAGALAAPR